MSVNKKVTVPVGRDADFVGCGLAFVARGIAATTFGRVIAKP